MKTTPLHAAHRALNAKLVDFAGWEMPIQYKSILEEAKAVRNTWGVFDVSHMARAHFRGASVLNYLTRLVPTDLTTLQNGQSLYTVLTNEAGGVIDDIIIYRVQANHYLIVFNAANREKDLAWFHKQASQFSPAPDILDETDQTVMIAAQGPLAVEQLERLFQADLQAVPRFGAVDLNWQGNVVFAGRTGYTGEDGFELVAPACVGQLLWDALVQAGAMPCGLGARDVLRVEAGLHLYGHELNDEINPIEAGLGWLVTSEADYIGSSPIREWKAQGTPRKLMGVVLLERGVPREGYPVLVGGSPVGALTSGVFSPTLEKGIGMGFVQAAVAKTGTGCEVDIRGKLFAANLTTRRFLKGR